MRILWSSQTYTHPKRRMIMKLRLLSFLLLVFLIATVGTAAADSPNNFRTHLSGGAEVPTPVDTHAQGQAIFQLSKDGTEMHYKLITANIEDLFMAHIHLAPAGQNGPIVVWLYGTPPPEPDDDLIPGRFDGVLAEGTITAGDLVGPLAGESLSALVDAIEEGNTYVNVHTIDFPGGEIRGQIH
jgi:hypothetical protein